MMRLVGSFVPSVEVNVKNNQKQPPIKEIAT